MNPNLGHPWSFQGRLKCLTVSREFDTDIKTLFFTTAHLEFRNQWMEGVKKIEDVDHFIPGIGSRHRCFLDDEQVILYTSSLSYDPQTKIIFSETDEKKTHAVYFILEPIGKKRSRFTVELYMSGYIMKFVFDFFMKKKMEGRMQRSMASLEKLLKGIVLPVEF